MVVVRPIHMSHTGLVISIVYILFGYRSAALPSDSGTPNYKLTFAVFYNSSGLAEVTTECGTAYAQSFLGSFIHSSKWLQTECQEQGVEGSLQINIANLATVKLYGSQVEISVNIYVSSLDGDRTDLVSCGSIINDTLQDLTDAPFINETRFLSGNCASVIMSPQKFYFYEVMWTCNENYSFISDVWACVEDGDPHDPTLPTDGTAVVTSVDTVTSSPEKETMAFSPTSVSDITQETTLVYTNHSSTLYRTTTTPLVGSPPHTTTSWYVTQSGVQEFTTASSFQDYWGIELINKNYQHIVISEGGTERKLGLRLWLNRTKICEGFTSANGCQITFDYSIAGGDYSSPICRKTGKSIPQVVFGRPSWGHKTGTPYCSLNVPDNVNESGQTTDLVLRAVSDNKYDGNQQRQLALSLTVTNNHKRKVLTQTLPMIPVYINDLDRKATCQSINDPHITTFDGLEYNNFYEGEFVLYRHKELPVKVHVVYQRCSRSVQASCNCAVAVQSGDDVLVIDRCYRQKKELNRISGEARDINPMSVQLYKNGNLTPGTKIYQEADGRKYYIYLPHGTYVKVIINGMLINVWVVASPGDMNNTEGLCGMYDTTKSKDLVFANGTYYEDMSIINGDRGQPVPMILAWRVEMGSADSLLAGVPKVRRPYEPPIYCQCQDDADKPYCAYSAHVDNCDILQGVDVTDMLVRNAITPTHGSTNRYRQRRDVEDNTISVISRQDPILIDKHFVPPKYKWHGNSHWNDVTANEFCTQYIRDNYTIGKLCSEIVPSVNFNQEINTCKEDIQITGNTSWANSARDAMKEQCLEEIQRSGSLPDDMADRLQNYMCINDCSQHGVCTNGTCHCEAGFTSADCSVSEITPPYAGELPHYGLCDIRNMNCTTVIVYGQNFVNSDSLTCFFQECQVTEQTYIPKNTIVTRKAIFINFNAVECVVPAVRSYLISVSNNGVNKSDPLLFVPFDPQCNTCNTFNTTCNKVRNSCIIDGMCYAAGESSPKSECLVCKPINDELQWTTLDEMKCQTPWWKTFKLPNWAVAVPAAIGGSIVGVLAGFLLYKCCCKKHKQREAGPVYMNTHQSGEDSPFEDAILHRNRGLPVFSSDRFGDMNLPQAQNGDYNESYFYNDGRGVENGVDSSTYF